MSRLDKVNSILHHELAESINRHLEMDGVLVTITEVECSPDLREAHILFSVLPEKYLGTVLKRLRTISGRVAHELRKRLKFREIPTFHWVFDDREVNAAKLEDVFHELGKDTE